MSDKDIEIVSGTFEMTIRYKGDAFSKRYDYLNEDSCDSLLDDVRKFIHEPNYRREALRERLTRYIDWSEKNYEDEQGNR